MVYYSGIYTAQFCFPDGFDREAWFAEQDFSSVAHFWAAPTKQLEDTFQNIWLVAAMYAKADQGEMLTSIRNKLAVAAKAVHRQALKEMTKQDRYMKMPYSQGVKELHIWEGALADAAEGFDGEALSVMAAFLEIKEVFEYGVSEPLVDLMVDALNLRELEKTTNRGMFW